MSGDTSELTFRTVRVRPEPGKYDAAKVRLTRQRLNVSQGVFAAIMGISLVLAQSWEQGLRFPSKLAQRLLDEINRDPERFRKMAA